MTERLKKCFDANSISVLFPMLKDWSQEELSALIVDIDDFYEDSVNKIKSSNIPAPIAEGAHVELIRICAEMSSVAQYYTNPPPPDTAYIIDMEKLKRMLGGKAQ